MMRGKSEIHAVGDDCRRSAAMMAVSPEATNAVATWR